MTNNEIAYEINFIGDMFHFKIFSKYDSTKTMIQSFYDTHSDISQTGFTGYLISKVNEDIKQKIWYVTNSLDIIGLDKKEIILNMNNERLGNLNISGNIIDLDDRANNILNIIKGKNTFMLEHNFNREFKENINFIYEFYKELPPPYENKKVSWEFIINDCFTNHIADIHTGIDLDYCRKKLNLNIIHKFIETNGLKIFEQYQKKVLNNELPMFAPNISELQAYYKNVKISKINGYINDMLYIIDKIAV